MRMNILSTKYLPADGSMKERHIGLVPTISNKLMSSAKVFKTFRFGILMTSRALMTSLAIMTSRDLMTSRALTTSRALMMSRALTVS
jgi:hypothetical protein